MVQRYNQTIQETPFEHSTSTVVGHFNPFETYICLSIRIISPSHRGEKNQSESLFNHHLGSIYYDSRSPIPIPTTYRDCVPRSIYAVIICIYFGCVPLPLESFAQAWDPCSPENVQNPWWLLYGVEYFTISTC